MSALQLASLLGTLESCRLAIWQAPHHFSYLQIQLIQALHQSQQDFDVSITLDHNPLADLKLWLLNTHSANGSPITPPAPTLFITTAASKTGWCALCQAHGKKRALLGRRNQTSYKRIRTQGCLLGLKGHLKESVSPRGLPENAQHHSNSPNKQQGQYRYRYMFRYMFRRTENHCRLGIEGDQRQQRM